VKVSIIIPVYNEFRTFPQVLERVQNAPLPEGCSREIIVVDDGSTDGTTEMLRQFSQAGIVSVHYSASNSGKGMAVRKGISLASGGVIVIQDGDLEYDPRDYARLLEPIISGDADIVYGSRFLSRSTLAAATGMALMNRIANRILTIAANLLYGARITDEATAYKAFRAPVLNGLRLNCKRFEFCPEVTAKVRRLGYRIHEVPISYNARGIAEGKKIRFHHGFDALWTLLKYRFVLRSKIVRKEVAQGAGALGNNSPP
jgi:dolichol-phosphate mannosyltransferase